MTYGKKLLVAALSAVMATGCSPEDDFALPADSLQRLANTTVFQEGASDLGLQPLVVVTAIQQGQQITPAITLAGVVDTATGESLPIDPASVSDYCLNVHAPERLDIFFTDADGNNIATQITLPEGEYCFGKQGLAEA